MSSLLYLHHIWILCSSFYYALTAAHLAGLYLLVLRSVYHCEETWLHILRNSGWDFPEVVLFYYAAERSASVPSHIATRARRGESHALRPQASKLCENLGSPLGEGRGCADCHGEGSRSDLAGVAGAAK